MHLDGKRILITGGGSGIGLELARRLAGANQVVIAGRDETKLERARAELPTVRTLTMDVTSEEEAQRAVSWLTSELGGLDLLVNNAGLLRSYPLSAPEAATKSVEDVDVNIGGSIRMTRLALPLLEASPEAAVVLMSSAVALAAVPRFAVYAATKAAVHSLARSLRAELRGSGIRVFEVLPPVVDTGPVRGLDVPKIAPAVVVDAIVAGIKRNRTEIHVGPVKLLAPLSRLAPSLADRIVVRALSPSANA
jgi:uncharacterized oxidoreductase